MLHYGRVWSMKIIYHTWFKCFTKCLANRCQSLIGKFDEYTTIVLQLKGVECQSERRGDMGVEFAVELLSTGK